MSSLCMTLLITGNLQAAPKTVAPTCNSLLERCQQIAVEQQKTIEALANQNEKQEAVIEEQSSQLNEAREKVSHASRDKWLTVLGAALLAYFVN